MSLDAGIKTQINTYLDALDDALDRMLLHTNILSGQVTPDRVVESLLPLLPDLVDLQPYVDAALAAAAASLSSANDANAFSYSAAQSAANATAAAANAYSFAGVAAASALDANSSAYAASVFAQFANTSANSSGNYAAAAQVAALQANSSANNANTYAGAAFTSAVAANTFANTSASWAAAAAASALVANTSANNALASASASAANAVSANNSAAAAAGNATLAASYSAQTANTYKATILIGGDPYFAQGLDGYSGSTWGSGASAPGGPWLTHTTGFSWPDSVEWPGGNGNNQLFSKKLFDVDTSKRYRFSAEFGTYRTGSSGETNTFYFGFVGLDATGTIVSHGAFGTYRYATTQGSYVLTDGQTAKLSSIVTGEGNDSYLKFPPGTKQVALMCIVNYTGTAQNSYIHYMTIEQVESEMLANAYAAVANSAAASANASAASANASAIVSAQISGVAAQMNRNPTFADWPGASGTIPAKWVDWLSGTTNAKQPGLISQNAFEQTNLIGTVNQGIYTDFNYDDGLKSGLGYYVLTGDVTLISGSLRGAGVYVQSLDSGSSTIQDADLDFYTMPDASGAAIGAGVAGQRYKFTKLIQFTSGTVYGLRIYCMVAWTGHGGGTNAAKVLRWHQCGIRPATDQEIAAKQALANTVTLAANVSTLTGAYASLDGKTSAYLTQVVTAGNASASVRLIANSSGGNTATSSVQLQASEISLITSSNTVLPTLSIANGVSQFTGKLRVGVGGSGARVEITDNLVAVYDANNVLRVRLGVW